MRAVVTGSASQSIRVWAYNSSGSAITGQVYNSAGIAVSVVVRSAGRIVSTTSLTLVARSTAGVWRSSAFTEVGSGEYVVDLPDSFCATADREVSVTLTSTAIAGGFVLSETLAVGKTVELPASVLSDISACRASTSLLTAGKRITVSADVGQSITLKIGDDYVGSRARQIQINDADQSLYNLMRDNTLTARAFGFGAGGQRDLVTGTFARDTITWTAASGSVPAYTTVYVECSVPSTLMAQVGIYDLQITDASGKKYTPVSSQCTLSADAKS